jgi:2-polyprenyl-3-methyl-5-hydroxy-6-metoxy-1,4-benzoquinol methylase
MSEPPPDAAAFWEGRYGERNRIWSGNPNPALVQTVSGLAPGRALDLGCGEGADSVWLAEQGWRVRAVDVSATALRRAEATAEARGLPAGQISWTTADLSTWTTGESFELVSACFLHSPVEFPRNDVLRRAAATVVPGGHLLVVGHAEPPPWMLAREGAHHHRHDMRSAAEDLADLGLDGAAWEAVVSEDRRREGPGPDGVQAVVLDAVNLLRRR